MRRIIAICSSVLCALVVTAASVSAQGRFAALTQETITQVPGLRIVTIRDNQLALCYTLFVFEPVPAPLPPAQLSNPTPPSPADVENANKRELVRAAGEKRDRQLDEARTRINPGQSAFNLAQFELARRPIENEFESTIAPLLPGSYAWESTAAGGRTGGWESVAEAMRRSMANADPATGRTFSDTGGLSPQLAAMFERMIAGPRLAASGPVACAPASTVKVPR
jgi:hypothetical protein